MNKNELHIIFVCAQGIGDGEKHAMTASLKMWGQNWLGEVLLNVRTRLREEMNAS